MALNRRRVRVGRAGFTLVEAVLSLGVLSVLLTAVINLLAVAYRHEENDRDRELAAALAHDLLAEILQSHYEDPDGTPSFGPETGESGRIAFDDVDDYDGLVETPPKGADAASLDDYPGFTREVVVDFVTIAQPSGPGSKDPADDVGLKRVKVTVAAPTGALVVLEGVRGVHDSFESEPDESSTMVRTVVVRLQIGEGRPVVTGATPVLNQVPLEGTP